MPPKNTKDDEPGIGVLPNGELNVVDPNDPPFEPIVMGDEDEGADDLSDIDDMVAAFKE